MEKDVDYSKYEPLRLDCCTVVTNVKNFLESHRLIVKAYGKKSIAKPYLDRGLLAMQRMKEIDEQK
jgi:hypothetical protein